MKISKFQPKMEEEHVHQAGGQRLCSTSHPTLSSLGRVLLNLNLFIGNLSTHHAEGGSEQKYRLT